ncbi:MAG: hypothetical protein CXT71_02865 [Methanobacteriota archaeon]|nr:MAG: hypothetical protein CXT71_02865 [Euryarchaeota archaeon]
MLKEQVIEMGGLLDKAEKVAEAVDATLDLEVNSNHKEAMISDEGMKGALFQIAGSIGLLVILGLIFYFKYVNWYLFGVSLIVSWAVFNAQELIEKNFNPTKLIATAVGWLVLSMAVMGGSFFIGAAGGVKITEITFDEDDDQLRITVYGSSGDDFHLEVVKEGTTLCSDDGSIGMDKTTISFPIADCWDGNAFDESGDDVIEYLAVVSSGSDVDSYKVPPAIMSREITGALVKVVELTSTTDNVEYDGLQVDMILGIDSETNTYIFGNGAYGGSEPLLIKADWSATIEVLYGGDTVYTYSKITSNEGLASGVGEFDLGWVQITSNSGGNLDRSHFYQDDGCYTFKISVKNEITGQTLVDDRSQLELFWDDNEADDDSANDQSAQNC